MKYLKFFTPVLVSALLFSACHKDDDHHDHEGQVTIHITSPEENASYTGSADVHIEATATAEFTLHGYDVSIINPGNNNEVLFHKHAHVHGSTLTISETWTNNVNVHSHLELVIDIHISHDGDDTVRKTRSFVCHPM